MGLPKVASREEWLTAREELITAPNATHGRS